jgi:hypothetical protein
MNRIHIWRVDPNERLKAVPLEAVHSSETERVLEDLLVGSPDLLQPQLVLVGRQIPTAGGPLDLLGVDADGRLVVFELKRGVLTRDAIAQVLDYASDLAAMSSEALARLVEENSGRFGIERITDFLEWYGQEHPVQPGPLAERPRMVLVGLGVDERALRVVNFLAETGVPIQLLTFHAFQAGGELFLAKQVESESGPMRPDAPKGAKEENRRILQEKAASLGVGDFLEEVARFVNASLGNVYLWPHKSLYSFNVADETAEGRATQRYIVSVGPNENRPGTLRLAFPERVLELGAEVEAMLTQRLKGNRVDTARYAVEVIVEPRTWPTLQDSLAETLRTIRRTWEERRSRASENSLGVTSHPEPTLAEGDDHDARRAAVNPANSPGGDDANL